MTDQALIITGAASGIGRSVAELAVARGARVARLDREAAEDGGATRAEGRVWDEVCDVRDSDEIERAFSRARQRLGPITGVVCSAGVDVAAPTHDVSDEMWREVLETNLTGTFNTCRAAIRAFRAQRSGGAIVCVSSPFGSVAPPGGAAAYCASKGGIDALVRAIAVEYAPAGIRVNAVVPGATETPLMWSNVEPEQVGATRKRIAEAIPAGRLATPGETAQAALWLLSAEASYVTGAQLACDGGVLAKAVLEV